MSTIDNAKKAMGWMHPNQRQSCGNCQHVVVSESHRMELRCKPGGFFTPRYAICDDYVTMALTDGSVPK
jgi:hypothetical protein